MADYDFSAVESLMDQIAQQLSSGTSSSAVGLQIVQPGTSDHSITITQNGKTKNTWADWRLVPASRPVIAPPEPKYQYVDIPGADGELDLTEVLGVGLTYKSREGSLEFIVMNDYNSQFDPTYENAVGAHLYTVPYQTTSYAPGRWAAKYAEIAGFLHGRNVMFALEDDPGYYYIGRMKVNQWKSDAGNSRITFDYHLDPYKYERTDSLTKWKWDQLNFETGVIREYNNIGVSGSQTLMIPGTPKRVIPTFYTFSSSEAFYYDANAPKNYIYNFSELASAQYPGGIQPGLYMYSTGESKPGLDDLESITYRDPKTLASTCDLNDLDADMLGRIHFLKTWRPSTFSYYQDYTQIVFHIAAGFYGYVTEYDEAGRFLKSWGDSPPTGDDVAYPRDSAKWYPWSATSSSVKASTVELPLTPGHKYGFTLAFADPINFTYLGMAYRQYNLFGSPKDSGIPCYIELNMGDASNYYEDTRNDSISINADSTLMDLVIEVLAVRCRRGGWYGNGSRRKAAIEALGYDYEKVQSRVNVIMASGKYNYNDLNSRLRSNGLCTSSETWATMEIPNPNSNVELTAAETQEQNNTNVSDTSGSSSSTGGWVSYEGLILLYGNNTYKLPAGETITNPNIVLGDGENVLKFVGNGTVRVHYRGGLL